MHIVIIGSGPGGCAAAHQIAQHSDARITLVEAGPDYGPFDAHLWPQELLDTRRIPLTHDWGLDNRDEGGRTYAVERARVLGGCSSHNGCCAVQGARRDYLAWQAATRGAWDADVDADYAEIRRLLRVRAITRDEISPFQRDVYDAARAAGLPHSNDINDLDEDEGAAISPMNKLGGVRWNAAFAFVDPLRGRRGFEIIDRCEIERLAFRQWRATAARGMRNGAPITIEGDVFVLAGGAYGTPAILQRSGVGDPLRLESAGIPLTQAVPAVGAHLQDHPCMTLTYAGSPALIDAMRAQMARQILYEEGVILKKRSSLARDGFDLHLFSSGSHQPHDRNDWYFMLFVGVLNEHARGRVDVDHRGALHIQHNHFSDRGGHDLQVMREGIAYARALAGTAPLAQSLLRETGPGAQALDDAQIAAWIRGAHAHYWHPAGSCRMGTSIANGDVCDGRGAVFGLGNVYVADASLMPAITTGNTNLPSALLGWRTGRAVAALAR